MSQTGLITNLFLSIKGQGREEQQTLTLDENGVVGDKFYGKNASRAILLTSKESYTLALKNGIEAKYGSLGENILIDVNPYSLSVGEKVYIGEVILEITHNCTICQSLAKVDPKLPELLANDRGIFAKCIQAGTISKNDTVTL